MTQTLTTTSVLASATDKLTAAGYSVIAESKLGDWRSGEIRGFEDPYGIVLLSVWDTWSALSREWTNAQSALVEMISAHVPRTVAKAWDGYLVLLCVGPLGTSGRDEVDRIRYDMRHTRKLVATSDEMQTLGDIERILSPLLPLRTEIIGRQEETVLELLPSLTDASKVPPESVKNLVEAFRAGRPLVSAIHKSLRSR